MSSRDNSESTGFALLIGGIAIMGAILFALAAFVALILSVLCLVAWNKPLKIGKMMIIEPYEARGFICGGVVGMWLLPLFAVFCAILFQFGIADYSWSYLFLGGYVAGAFGTIWFLEEQAGNRAQAQPEALPGTRPAPLVIDQQPSQPYRFASWDDEEELK